MNFPHKRALTPKDLENARQSVAPLSRQVQEAIENIGSGAIVIAWLSDLHIHAASDYGEHRLGSYGTQLDTSANLLLALEEVKALEPRPDVLIFGGDLSDTSYLNHHAGEYAQLNRIFNEHLPPDIPTLAILGNHDRLNPPLTPEYLACYQTWRRQDWPDLAGTGDFDYSAVRSGWRFIGLDTRFNNPNEPFTKGQRQWLAEQLADTSHPTIVLQHRPFIKCENWVDEHRTNDDEAFQEILTSATVRAVFSGHTHKAACFQHKQQTHTIFPALAYGIEDKTGWGIVVIAPESDPAIFVKELSSQPGCQEDGADGQVRKLEPQLLIFEAMRFTPSGGVK